VAQRLLLEGSDIDELLQRVRVQHGPDAEIVSAQERLVGGVGGFFARRRYEVSVQVPDRAVASAGAVSETTAQPSHPGREHSMTAHGSASPLASTIYDALRDAAGGGSLDDLLSVADRQDGAVSSGGAPGAAGFGA
jgi:hypothetical protein